MTYLEKKNIDEAIRQKMRKKDVYKSYIRNIYNIIISQANTFQEVKTDRSPIGYLMILKRLCFSKKSDQNPIRSLCLATRRLYNTIQ